MIMAICAMLYCSTAGWETEKHCHQLFAQVPHPFSPPPPIPLSFMAIQIT